jgi:hypothetical protein
MSSSSSRKGAIFRAKKSTRPVEQTVLRLNYRPQTGVDVLAELLPVLEVMRAAMVEHGLDEVEISVAHLGDRPSAGT